jgi:tRNA A37 threonylcarbamoyladenosine dehydratase
MRTPGNHPTLLPSGKPCPSPSRNAPYRMLHAYGAKIVKRLRKLRIAIVGARGVGVEVAKCLTLSGVRLLHMFDDEPVRARDLGSNFALQSSDIGKPRAAATVPFLQRLNESVTVSAMAGLPDPAHYDVVVATRLSRASAIALNAACRASVKDRSWFEDENKGVDDKYVLLSFTSTLFFSVYLMA